MTADGGLAHTALLVGDGNDFTHNLILPRPCRVLSVSITRATPVRSLPGEAILPQSEWRARCVLWTLYHKAGRKGSAARGKRKKICLFRQMSCTIPCGRISALSGLPWASHLPQGGRQVSPSCRGVAGLFHVKSGPDWPKLWAGKSACPLRLAYGKPPPPEGEVSFRVLPRVCWFVSRETRPGLP